MDRAPGPAASTDGGFVLDVGAVPAPDATAEPAGFLVEADDGARIHFLDWQDRAAQAGRDDRAASRDVGVVLVAGGGETAWAWTPVARRLRSLVGVVATDLRGHGLSDAPLDGYDVVTLAADVVAVVDSTGLLDRDAGAVVLAGHGFGGAVAAAAAGSLGERCAGVVLVDGGWEALAETTDLAPDEFLRSLDEPPEVLRSMAAWLADRAGFDPDSWDLDQERAAREAVAELPSGRLVPAVQPHVRAALVDTMFAYDPVATLRRVRAPILALVARAGADERHAVSVEGVARAVPAAGRGPAIRSVRFPEGHNLMRYRPAEVTAAILLLVRGHRLDQAEGRGQRR